MNNIKNIDFSKDTWNLGKDKQIGQMTLSFQSCPNEWFKNAQKQTTLDCLTSNKLKKITIVRYNSSLHHFYKFLDTNKIQLNDFSELTNKHIEHFIFQSLQSDMSKSSVSTCLSALKWFVKHGIIFNYSGFPPKNIFSGEEHKLIKMEDTLKTKEIPTSVFSQIENALKNEKDLLLKSLIEIGIDTGIRISEALSLTTKSLIEDFTGKPLLHVISTKNNSERYIPVSARVKRAFNVLVKLSEESRVLLDSDIITAYYKPLSNRHDFLMQADLRKKISAFSLRHNILDLNGQIFNLTYHSFRHTLGTQMLNKEMSIFEIQDYLGHDSLHSTSIYAKLKNPTLFKEYKKLGFIGIIADSPKKIESKNGISPNKTTLKTASLPDGICGKPIDNEGNFCSKYNMCLLCPKFITTPKHLDIHKNHLQRIKNDKEQYMSDEYIGSIEHLEKIEYALETVISKLEEMFNGTK